MLAATWPWAWGFYALGVYLYFGPFRDLWDPFWAIQNRVVRALPPL